MTEKIATTFVFACIALSLFPSANSAQQPSKTAEEVFLSWVRWCEALKELSPLHIVVVESSSHLDSLGCDSQINESYQYANELHALERQNEAADGKAMTVPKSMLSLYRSDLEPNMISMSKNTSRDDWVISQRFDEKFQHFLISKFYSEIPVYDANRPFTEQYQTELLESSGDDDTTQVFRFTSLNPQKNIANIIPLEYVLTVNDNQNGLPVKIDGKYEFASSEVGRWVTIFSDWSKVGSLSIPHKKLTEAHLPSGDKVRVASLEFSTIEFCAKSEVEQRCSMSFYDLPSLPSDESSPNSNFVYWAFGTIVLIGVLLIWIRRS